MYLELSYTLENIDDAVLRFWEQCREASIFAFSGEMGAGKTTFIHYLCDHLGVQDTVSSPTFALINEYHFGDQNGRDNIIFHLDWYRLKNAEEAVNAGMEDCIIQAAAGQAFCFVEWPEKAAALLRTPYYRISIDAPGPSDRTMSVTLIK